MAFLPDGYSTTITLGVGLGPPLVLREKEAQPPGIEIGEIETTTMRNVGWRTKWPKRLATLTDVTLQCEYDPLTVYPGLVLGVVMTIGVAFPDGTGVAFFGWVDSFKPSNHKEGELPLAEVKIIPSLQSVLAWANFPNGNPITPNGNPVVPPIVNNVPVGGPSLRTFP